MADDVREEPHVFPLGRKPGEMLFCTMMLIISGLLIAAIGWETTWLEGKRLSAQPRFWPTLSLCGVALFAGLNWLSRNQVERTPGRWKEAGIWVRSLEYVGWYILYVWAIPVVGYLPATVVFCVGLTLRLGYRGRAVLAAIGFALFVVLFFKSAMNVKMPGGAIYQLAPEGLRYILLRYF